MQRMTGRSSIEDVVLDWAIDQPVLPRRLPVSLLSKAQIAAELQRVQREKAIAAAYEAEPGWTVALDADGTLHVTTPSGVTRTTRPPGLRPPSPARSAAREHPPQAAPLDDEPPPF